MFGFGFEKMLWKRFDCRENNPGLPMCIEEEAAAMQQAAR